MISEVALSRSCRPAVFSRGRIIARRPGRIWRREVRFEGALTKVFARVDSTSGYADHYLASVALDETADELVDYDCSCLSHGRHPGPCKHCVALVLDYNRNPTSFEGFEDHRHAGTSQALGAYLERVRTRSHRRLVASRDQADQDGAIGLEPMLVLTSAQRRLLRLRVSGRRGSYAIRDVAAFAQSVQAGAWVEYGKNLAFTHELGAFDPSARALVTFLTRAVQNRQAYAPGPGAPGELGRRASWGAVGPSSARDLPLSDPETDELMGLMAGRRLAVEASPAIAPVGGCAQAVEVVQGDPEVVLDVVEAGEGGFLLRPASRLTFFATATRLYALGATKLWCCSSQLSRASDFLTSVWRPSQDQHLSREDAPAFAAALPPLRECVKIRLPDALRALEPCPASFQLYLDRRRSGVTCSVVASYGDRRFDVLDHAVGERMDVTRDALAEAAMRQLVGRYFPVTRTLKGKVQAMLSTSSHDDVARLVFEGVPELAQKGELLVTDAFSRLASTARPRVRVGAAVRSGLLEVTISTDDLPLDELPALLASCRQRRRYHRLRDGSFLDLSTLDLGGAGELLDELGLGARELASGRVQIPAYKAFLLDGLLDDDQRDASLEEYLAHVRSLDLASFLPPTELAPRLRGYQLEGFQWLSALCEMGMGGILADEMGLGKSVQLIGLIEARHAEGPSLVVCPASLVYNWQAEFEKFAPGLDVVVVAGGASQRASLRQESHEVYVTSYDLLRRDVKGWSQKPLWLVALDEAQYIKNHETLVARATKALDARHRFALTGTPVENRLAELWSIFDFLMPGLLGAYERFRDRYEQPIADGDADVAERLRRAVGPFILRRRKTDVLKDLPDKLEQVVHAHMDRAQSRLYHAHEQALRLSLANRDEGGLAADKIQVLAELTRLRQICCDPRLLLDDYRGGSCKLDTIMELVTAAIDAQQKVLVFSQFTSYLTLIEGRLVEQGVAFFRIDGSTPKRRRVELVDAFNADETPVFLVSLKAGGTGLNLVGASVVIHADPWWNAAAQNQATDRAHRIGQTRAVSVYKVIAADTIEERIMALQESKSKLADQVVGEGAGLSLAGLRREDLLELLGEQTAAPCG